MAHQDYGLAGVSFGYTGYVVLAPIGTKRPPVSETQPMRPDDHGGGEEAEG
jgi:hypothetical protein